MNYNNSTDTYVRSAAKIGMRQQVLPRELFRFSGWSVLLRPCGKILLMILPLVLVINMGIASMIANVERSLVSVDNHRHELMDKNIELLARKASLWAPDSIRQMAGEKLGLYPDSGDQIAIFDKRSGTFFHP